MSVFLGKTGTLCRLAVKTLSRERQAQTMLCQDTVNEWLAVVGAPIGLDLSLDARGSVSIALHSGRVLTLQLEEQLGALHLCAALLQVPGGVHRAPVLEEAMALNLSSRATEGATLGLDRARDQLVLSVTRFVDDLTVEGFVSTFSTFAEVAEMLQARLSSPALVASQGASAILPSASQQHYTVHSERELGSGHGNLGHLKR